MNDTSHLVVNHLRHPNAVRWNDVLRHESEDTVTDLSEFSFRLSRFKSLLSSCLYFTPCSCNNSWYDDSASDSLREFGQILWKITFSHLQDSMMDFCMAATLSTVLDNGTLNRTASDSSLCRRSSARHLSLAVWSPVQRRGRPCRRAYHQRFSGLDTTERFSGRCPWCHLCCGCCCGRTVAPLPCS